MEGAQRRACKGRRAKGRAQRRARKESAKEGARKRTTLSLTVFEFKVSAYRTLPHLLPTVHYVLGSLSGSQKACTLSVGKPRKIVKSVPTLSIQITRRGEHLQRTKKPKYLLCPKKGPVWGGPFCSRLLQNFAKFAKKCQNFCKILRLERCESVLVV